MSIRATDTHSEKVIKFPASGTSATTPDEAAILPGGASLACNTDTEGLQREEIKFLQQKIKDNKQTEADLLEQSEV